MHRAPSYLLRGALVLVLWTFATPAPAPAQTSLSTSKAQFVPDHVLVRFAHTRTLASLARVHEEMGTTVMKTFTMVPNLQLVRLPQGMSVAEGLRRYRARADVLYAEPDYIVHALATPNDPQFPTVWNLNNTGQFGIDGPGTAGADIKALSAWDITTGSPNVVVGVIDTGVDYNHVDLAANMHPLMANGTNGANGCFGISPIGTGSPNPFDDVDHGTHVSGTIGAVGNNGIGVVGVNWQVGLVACKFLGQNGGTTSDAITCLNYLKDLKDNHGLNLVATNNSWGGGGYSQALADAIDAHRQSGILFIAAAGNDYHNNAFYASFPANFYLPNVISVAATTRRDAAAYFSNLGRRRVHLGAPGQAILSTLPNNAYGSLNGTSMATPHVTGVAALLKAQDPNRDWKTIRNLILAGGDSISAMQGQTITEKRLNAYGSMVCANSVITSRLKPVYDTLVVSATIPTTLAMLNINCATPNGNLVVNVQPGGGTVTLRDDGVAPDQEAGDGIYSAGWLPQSGQDYTLQFPDGSNVTALADRHYTYSIVPFQYRTLTTSGFYELNLGDDTAAWVAPPFPIHFGGFVYNQVTIGSNGAIGFDVAIPSPGNSLIPFQFSNQLIAPYWTDLFPQQPYTTENVFWQEQGSIPNREMVIEWRDVPHYADPLDPGCASSPPNVSPQTVKFQVVFFENSEDVLFNYARTGFGCAEHDYGASATVGIQLGPDAGTQFSFNSPSLSDNTSILWTDVHPAAQFQLSAPLSVTAGVAGTVTVTALNQFGIIAANYTGTVHFTSNDGAATLSADYTFTPGDGGVHVFNGGVTLRTAGSRVLAVTDLANGSVSGAASINVNPAAASQLGMSAPLTAKSGLAFTIALTARDAFNNLATGYTGTVHFTSGDNLAGLPGDYTFTSGPSADNGQHIFTNAFTLVTFGTQSLAATDTQNGAITASKNILVNGDFPLSASGRTLYFRPGQPLNMLVATFIDGDGSGTAQQFTATIDWGDGTMSGADSIAPNASGGFDVNATHTYNGVGAWTVKVTIQDVGGALAIATSRARLFPRFLSLPLP